MKYSLSQTAQAIVDLKNGTYKAYSQESSEKFNEAIRAKFIEIMPTANAMGK